jgi:hypothetical protein
VLRVMQDREGIEAMNRLAVRLVRLEANIRQTTARDFPRAEAVQPEEVVEIFRHLADQGNAEARQVLSTLDAATGGQI